MIERIKPLLFYLKHGEFPGNDFLILCPGQQRALLALLNFPLFFFSSITVINGEREGALNMVFRLNIFEVWLGGSFKKQMQSKTNI